MYVNLLSYASGEKKVLAQIRVTEGKLQVEGDLWPDMLKMLEFEYQNFEGTDDAFLKYLPLAFTGAYTKAQVVKD